MIKEDSDDQRKATLNPEDKQEPLQFQQPDHRYSIAFLIGIIFLEIAIAILYGFFMRNTEFNYNTQTEQERVIANPYKLQFVLANVLAVLGFGLLMVHHRNTIRQTLFTALFVAAINLQLSPLFQKLWLNAFITKFKFYQNDYTGGQTLMIRSALNKNISLSFMTISSFCTIALLLGLSPVMGRIGIFNLLATTFIFCCGFNLNYYLNFRILQNFDNFSVYDDMHGSRIFCFAAGFGLALIILYRAINPISKNYLHVEQEKNELLKKNKSIANVIRYENNLLVAVFTLLGAGFVLCFFYYVLDPYYTFSMEHRDYAYLNVIMAFSSNILTCMAMSCIFRGRININFINYGVLAGFIYIAVLATFIERPFVAMIVGSAGGILTSFGLLLHQTTKMSEKYLFDPKGFIPVVFFSCIFSSYVAIPIIIRGYQINQGLGNDGYNQGRHMIYSSVSLGIGFFTGAIAGILRKLIKQTPAMTDITFFSSAFSIYRVKPQQSQKGERTLAFAPKQEGKTRIGVSSGFVGSYMFEQDDEVPSRNQLKRDQDPELTSGKFSLGKNSEAIMLQFD